MAFAQSTGTRITAKMPRFVAFYMLCFLLIVGQSSGSPKFAHALSIPELSPRHEASLRSPPKSNTNDLLPIDTFLTNTTNTTNDTTVAPTPAIAPAPTTAMPTPTPKPTKKYEPSPDDEEEEEKKEGTKIGVIFLWIVVAFTLIWVVCYFRDAILFFFATAWNNTQRYGCKGCLQSFFPCILGSRMGSGGNEPLDQIIFETEDHTAPLI